MVMMWVFWSTGDHYPMRLLLSLDRTLVLMVPSGQDSVPDVAIWFMKTKTIIWIELPCPWEENPIKKHFEKMDNKLRLTCEKESTMGEVDGSTCVCQGRSKRSNQ